MPYIFLLQFPVCLKNVAEWATYLGEPRFKSWPGDRLYWLKNFAVLLNLSQRNSTTLMELWQYLLKLGHSHILLHSFQFIIYYSLSLSFNPFKHELFKQITKKRKSFIYYNTTSILLSLFSYLFNPPLTNTTPDTLGPLSLMVHILSLLIYFNHKFCASIWLKSWPSLIFQHQHLMEYWW
jgi:hypothetical protein